MHVGMKVGLALGIGAAGGVALGAINEPDSVSSSLAHVAIGTGIAGAASRYMVTGPHGRIAPWAAALGATIAAAGVTTLFRGGDDRPEPAVFNPAEHLDELQAPTRTTALPAPSREQPRFDPLRAGGG